MLLDILDFNQTCKITITDSGIGQEDVVGIYLPADVYTWKVDAVTYTESNICIHFEKPIRFNSITYDFIASTSPVIECCYSLDNIIWEEFQYFKYTLTDASSLSNEEQHILSRYAHNILKIVKLSGADNTISRFYSVYIPSQQRIDIIPNSDYIILSRILDQVFANNSDDILNISYVFVDADISLYENFYITGIRLRLTDYIGNNTVPLSITNLSIIHFDEIELMDTNPSIFCKNLYQPKYFEEFTMFPSITETYFKMLEHEVVGKEFIPVILDHTAPYNVTISINEGAWTSSSVINLTLTATDDISNLYMCFSNNGELYSDWELFQVNKSNWSITGSGEKTIYVKIRDTSYNVTINHAHIIKYPLWANIFSDEYFIATDKYGSVKNLSGSVLF